jgi:hypothetical protein
MCGHIPTSLIEAQISVVLLHSFRRLQAASSDAGDFAVFSLQLKGEANRSGVAQTAPLLKGLNQQGAIDF